MTLRSLTRATLILSLAVLPVTGLASGGVRLATRVPSPQHIAKATVANERPRTSASQAQTPPRGAQPVFGGRLMKDGSKQVYADVPGLRFENTSQADGRATIVLIAGGDRVDVAVSRAAGMVVLRGGKTATVSPINASDAQLAAAQAVLSGSDAVHRFRTLAQDLDASDPTHPGVMAVQIADAVVGILAGDTMAPLRVAQRLRPHRASGIHPAKNGGESDCWYTYEQELNNALNDYEQCAQSFSWWNPLSSGCAAEWALRAEGYFSEYLSCSSLGALVKAH